MFKYHLRSSLWKHKDVKNIWSIKKYEQWVLRRGGTVSNWNLISSPTLIFLSTKMINLIKHVLGIFLYFSKGLLRCFFIFSLRIVTSWEVNQSLDILFLFFSHKVLRNVKFINVKNRLVWKVQNYMIRGFKKVQLSHK